MAPTAPSSLPGSGSCSKSRSGSRCERAQPGTEALERVFDAAEVRSVTPLRWRPGPLPTSGSPMSGMAPLPCDNWGVDEILVMRCGLVPYEEARRAQKRLEAARLAGDLPDVLLLLEHPPVY